MNAEFEAWAQSAKTYFQRSFGLTGPFALTAARLYIAFWANGLSPRIARGWSDPEHQKALRAAWDRGDRAGLRVRPAASSKHTKTNFIGNPASEAIDMPTNDDRAAARIAGQLGAGAGMAFSTPDPGHYFFL